MQPALILYDDEEKGATDAMVKYGVGIIEQSGNIGEKIAFKSDQ